MTKTLYINREISWLHFNARVLQEAADESVPLLERIKFLGIFANNLDEFYRVRVATLSRMLRFNKKKNPFIDFNPQKILKQINKIEKEQQKEFLRIFRRLVRMLATENIFLINEKQLTKEQGNYVLKYFRDHVRSVLFPLILGNLKDASTLKDNSIYLAVLLSSSQNRIPENYALIKIPATALPRFVILPQDDDKKYIILLDDVIRFGLPDIFSIYGYDRFSAYTIKFTRDAEIDIDNDVSKSFLEVMTESLKQRKQGATLRLIYDKSMPEQFLELLLEKMNITKSDSIVKGGRYENFKDFMEIPGVARPDLEYPKAPPVSHPNLPVRTSIFEVIRHKDIMLHYPYQSYHHIIDLLREASIDPHVRAIKMTLYRVAPFSNVVNALINAARNGKEVTVFLELQARFDEEANIFWSEKMQEEGVRIIHSIPGFKVHSKLLLIRRKENNQNVYYANIGTGNFNEQTARIYADDSLLTADTDITADVNRVFYILEAKYKPPNFRKLIVAPFSMRNFFVKMLNNEIRNAKEGKPAWVVLKMNSLSDRKTINKLYKVSQAGVKIDLIVRGICSLAPGIKGLSENIRAISIIDRFLEHSRVLVFCNGGDEKYYISSADWMIRNFDNRIEVACPINDPVIKTELRKMIDLQIADNTKARYISDHNPNQYVSNGGVPVRSQVEIYNYFSPD